MPTKKKRVGFIPRDDVMKIIDKLSFENNLSNSKIISILVEEALSRRGIFNTQTGKERQTSANINELKDISSKNSLCDDDPDNLYKLNNKNILSEINFSHLNSKETFDLKTYAKYVSFMKFQEMISRYEE